MRLEVILKNERKNSNPEEMNKLRALNRAPLIDRFNESLRVLSYFSLKFERLDLQARLVEYKEVPEIFEPSSQKSSKSAPNPNKNAYYDLNSKMTSNLLSLDQTQKFLKTEKTALNQFPEDLEYLEEIRTKKQQKITRLKKLENYLKTLI